MHSSCEPRTPMLLLSVLTSLLLIDLTCVKTRASFVAKSLRRQRRVRHRHAARARAAQLFRVLLAANELGVFELKRFVGLCAAKQR